MRRQADDLHELATAILNLVSRTHLVHAQLLTARLFAAVVILAASAIALFWLLSALERRVAWWGPRA